MTRAPLAIVVAIGDGGVIGINGELPWRIPEDMRHFKSVTMGHAIVMGRKTFESIGKPLPGRRNVVVSRSPSFSAPGCDVVASFEEAVALARQTDDEPRIIGGSSIYEAALPVATRIFLTEVHRKLEGDTFFPAFDRSEWREVDRRKGESEGVEFVALER
ncbi:Dihydrofolate reductase [Labilithrix luteola]|uniref:Dihydrofolate reductase n=1 Tax=Labilithrix luteola TaxID=1391654 RepID=A0A0K1PM72_9BACT|nr:dihydrofolate reductase [Labilithrix luteola]AKU94625.1 Dihydrofolate reductase [Labilithrix luteola]